MKPVHILIVEDEPFIAQDLALRLETLGFVITDIADTGADALKSVERNRPDLVLLDINLKGEHDGVQVAEYLRRTTELPFIFLTALADDATLERAKRTRPAAYLLKPFNDRRIKIAIDLALLNREEAAQPQVNPSTAPKSSVFLKFRGQYHKIVLEKVLWIEADGNYSTLHVGSDRLVMTIAIGQLMDKLGHPSLVRTHRSYAVNVEHISRFEEHRLFIGETEIPISRSHREDIRRRLNLL